MRGCSPLSCSKISYKQLFDILFCLITGTISYLFPELCGANFVLLWYDAVGCNKAGLADSSVDGNHRLWVCQCCCKCISWHGNKEMYIISWTDLQKPTLVLQNSQFSQLYWLRLTSSGIWHFVVVKAILTFWRITQPYSSGPSSPVRAVWSFKHRKILAQWHSVLSQNFESSNFIIVEESILP